MVAKTNFKSLGLVLILIISLLTGCGKSTTSSEVQNSSNSPEEKKIVKVGITQIVEHPALDAARKGFLDALAANGFKDGENLEIDFQNAQGDMPTAQTIAQNFASSKKDMILAIATPTAQAAFNATKEIPILITAVTDPVQAGLAQSLEKSGTNVTGTSDAAPMEKQFELLKKLAPKAKNIGILYNTSEANSEVQVEQAKKAATKFGFEIVTSGVTNVNEISQSLDSLLKKIDVLYTPTDNVVASSISLIATKCNEKNIPIIAAEKGMVEGGALATEGIDYYKLGLQTGNMAVEILKGKTPQELPLSTLEDTELVINEDTAKKLNITIPEDLKSKATFVQGGK
jgi:putative tryptophan/tyrosine transport system substrate-binding protein